MQALIENLPLVASRDVTQLLKLCRVDAADLAEIKGLRRERAAGGEETAFRKFFRRDLHSGLVRNLRQVGVLTPRIEPQITALRPIRSPTGPPIIVPTAIPARKTNSASWALCSASPK